MTTRHPSGPSRLAIVGPAECMRLLESVPVGRLIYTHGGLPAIRLVNFVLDQDTVVFSTGLGDKFQAAERGDVVAFEADDLDAEHHLGWTVTAIGHLSVLPAQEAIAAHDRLRLQSWLPIHDAHLVRLAIESVRGRRLVPWEQRPRTGA